MGDEYVDNDASAFTSSASKRRPQYQWLLADLADGYRDAVIVYNLDRLTRQPMELEEFTRLCEGAGVTQVKSVTADIDPGNDDGLCTARILAAIASKESSRECHRLRRNELLRGFRTAELVDSSTLPGLAVDINSEGR